MTIEHQDNINGVSIYTALSTDSKPTSGRAGMQIWETDTGDIYEFDSGTWRKIRTTDSSGDPAVSTVGEFRDAASGILRYQVTPTLTGVATPEVIVDATASNTVLSAIAVFNALDIVTAGDAVKNRYPDVKRIELDESIAIESDDVITKVWMLAFGTVDNTASNVIAEATTTGSDIRTALLEFTFSAVDEVKTVEISLGSKKTSGTSVVPSRYATIRVEGYSHA